MTTTISRRGSTADAVATPVPASRGESPLSTAEHSGLRPVSQPHSVRRRGPVDSVPLREQVARRSEKTWNREDAAKKNDFFCFAQTRHIVFRFVPPDLTRIRYSSRPLWNLWQRWLLPIITRRWHPMAAPNQSVPRPCSPPADGRPGDPRNAPTRRHLLRPTAGTADDRERPRVEMDAANGAAPAHRPLRGPAGEPPRRVRSDHDVMARFGYLREAKAFLRVGRRDG